MKYLAISLPYRSATCVDLPLNSSQNPQNKNIGTQGVQEFCELKATGGSSTQWTFSRYEKVNPISLFGYDVQRKQLKFLLP